MSKKSILLEKIPMKGDSERKKTQQKWQKKINKMLEEMTVQTEKNRLVNNSLIDLVMKTIHIMD